MENKWPKFLLPVLSVLFGAVFIYSGYTKLNPVQVFEYTLVEFVKMPWLMAAFTARLFIGMEFALGGLTILNLFGKNKWILKFALSLLLVFTLYLLYLWGKYGNTVNCGCFGDTIWMSPAASILKNGLLLIVAAILIRYQRGFRSRLNNIITPILFLVISLSPFLFFSIPGNKPGSLSEGQYKMDLSPVYLPGNKIVPSVELNKNKYIIAFLSPNCPHCRIAAYKMHLMKEDNPTLPFFFIFGGTESDLTEFWQITKAQNILWSRLDRKYFLQYTGGVFPLIIWLDNGIATAKSTYLDLDQDVIEKWLKNDNKINLREK